MLTARYNHDNRDRPGERTCDGGGVFCVEGCVPLCPLLTG